MKLFGFRKKKDESRASTSTAIRCNHPVTHQVPLRQDTSSPNKVTAMKCTQCGEIIPVGNS